MQLSVQIDGKDFDQFTDEAKQFQKEKNLKHGDDLYYAYAKFELRTAPEPAKAMVKRLKDLLSASEKMLGELPVKIEVSKT